MQRLWIAVSLVAVSLTAGGCSFAPEYQRPALELPQAWATAGERNLEVQWWKRFNDETLNTLVEEALHNNLDLEQAMARVDQARAQLGTARSNLAPTPSVDASARHTLSAHGTRVNEYGASGGIASWELDLWGKYRNSAKAARAQLLASEAGRDAVRLSVAGNTAKTYFLLRAYALQEQTAQRVLHTREEAHKIYANRYEQGLINELDLLRDEAEVETARNSLYNARIARDAAESALAVLVGRSPADIMKPDAIMAGDLGYALPTAPVLPDGLPSDLLERRPDIRQAEESLKAANFNIGVARASYFPSLSLTGLLGVVSPQLNSLFTADGRYTQGAGGLHLPLDPWRTKSSVAGAEAQKREAVAVYEQTVQRAFQDMRDALTGQEQYALAVQSQSQQVKVLSAAVTHARNRYDNGYSSYLDLLDAERSLFSATLNLFSTRANQLSSIVDVCLALGGGWE